jgi:hypothetical protein
VNVQAGDILLFRVGHESGVLDKLIGWGQKVARQAPSKEAYCHATMVGPDATHMYESRWPRFHNIPINLPELAKYTTPEAYRIKGITPDQILGMMKSAESHIGEWYPWLDILSFGKLQIGGACYCSESVWRDALNGAGIRLCDFDKMESPDDLAASPMLIRVT